jgi:hypothetical protein
MPVHSPEDGEAEKDSEQGDHYAGDGDGKIEPTEAFKPVGFHNNFPMPDTLYHKVTPVKPDFPRPCFLPISGASRQTGHLMKDQIERLKELSSALEPTLETRAKWTHQAVAHAEQFIGSVAGGPALLLAPDEGKGVQSAPLSEGPEDPAAILKLLAEHVKGPGGRLGHPGFLGFIPISSLYPAALGDYLAAVINPFAGNFFASPGAVRLEHLLTRWMARFVGYPPTAAGDLTSGGSIANLTAVVTAREARELKSRDYSKAVVYLTYQTHHSVAKALRIYMWPAVWRGSVKSGCRAGPGAGLRLLQRHDLAVGLAEFLAEAEAETPEQFDRHGRM